LGPTTLLSVGIGTRMALTRWGFMELFWGHRLRDVVYLGEADPLQDNGISFRMTLHWP